MESEAEWIAPGRVKTTADVGARWVRCPIGDVQIVDAYPHAAMAS
jgi:hypothetical protein